MDGKVFRWAKNDPFWKEICIIHRSHCSQLKRECTGMVTLLSSPCDTLLYFYPSIEASIFSVPERILMAISIEVQ
jgi:hypothetical protein